MEGFDGAAFGKQIVAEVKLYLETATTPLLKRLDSLENDIRLLRESTDLTVRRDADFSTALHELGEALKALPLAPDIPAIVSDSLALAMRTFDEGLESRIQQVLPPDDAIKAMVGTAVDAAVALIPPAKNGLSITELSMDQDNQVFAFFEDGRKSLVGRIRDGVNGKDVDLAAVDEVIKMRVTDAVGVKFLDMQDVLKGEPGAPGKDFDPSLLVGEAERIKTEVLSAVLTEQTEALLKSQTEILEDLTEKVSALVPQMKGDPGENVDPIALGEMVQDAVKAAVMSIPPAKDGVDGKDIDPEVVKQLVAEAVSQIPLPVDGRGIEKLALDDNGQLLVCFTGENVYDVVGTVRGADGKDAAEVDIDQIIDKAAAYIDEKVAALPAPVSIKSAYISDTGELWLEIGDGGHTNLGKIKADEVDLVELNAQIKNAIEEVVAAIPPAPAGKDAVIDPAFVKQLVFEEVALQVTELPKPVDGKDGVGIKEAKLSTEGMLVLVRDDDQVIHVGRVLGNDGKDVDPDYIRGLVADEVATIPVPVNGKDGRGIKTAELTSSGSLTVVFDDDEAVTVGVVVGTDGKDADMDAIQAIIAEKVAEMPVPVNGKDGLSITDVKLHENGHLNLWYSDGKLVDLGVVKGTDVDMGRVEELIRTEVAAFPRPQDGKSVTVDDVTPLLTELVSKAVAEIPVPKDGANGIGLAGAFIDREGGLVITLTNGETKQLGLVVGRDGTSVDMNVVAATIKQHVDSIPRPKDGLDGVGFDDMDVVYDEETKEVIVSAAKGDNAQSWKFFLPTVVDMGVYRDGKEYLRGDGTTFGGSFWIAQKNNVSEKPGTGDAWRLAVKKGRDGKDRPVEPRDTATSVKLEG